MPWLALFLLGVTDSGELVAPTSCVSGRSPNVCRQAPISRGFINGARAAVDPLGRGVWVVDEENDEVLLVGRPAPRTSAANVQRFRVGAWPEQVLPTPGGRTFVTARQAGVVAVIEPNGTTWSIPLGTEPKAMTLDLATNRLFVGLVTALEVASLDAETGAVLRRRALTTPPDFLALSPAGVLVASRRSDVFEALDLELCSRASFSGTLARTWSLKPFTFRLKPFPFRLPSSNEQRLVGLTTIGDHVIVTVEQAQTQTSESTVGYGGAGARSPIQRWLVEATVTPDGLLDEGLSDMSSSPVADLLPLADQTLFALEGQGTIFSVRRATATTRRGPPRSLMLDGTLSTLAMDDDRSLVVVSRSRRAISWYPAAMLRRVVAASAMVNREPGAEVSLPPSAIDPVLRRGRELFFSSDVRVTRGGLTCATCHPDGREDGRTWSLGMMLRQTPMLAERLRDTAPYNWLGTKRTLEANVSQTIRERLLGQGLGRADLTALSRYLLEGLRPVQKPATSGAVLLAEGRTLFHDEEVGCAQCHDSERNFTDGKNHDVGSLLPLEVEFAEAASLFGLLSTTRLRPTVELPHTFNTPSLKHLALTAPYLHNGSAPTLSALIDDNHGRIGATSQLSAHERTALVAYLESL